MALLFLFVIAVFLIRYYTNSILHHNPLLPPPAYVRRAGRIPVRVVDNRHHGAAVAIAVSSSCKLHA